MRQALRLLAAALAVAGGGAQLAHADGAFPDEQQIFLPASAPHTIVLGTNFGVLRSDDDGASWSLVCESLISGNSITQMYQLGPDGTVYAGFGHQIAHSTDQGCTWSDSPPLPGLLVFDLFADPARAERIFAIGLPAGTQGLDAVYVSTDHAATFAPLLAGDAGGGGYFTSVESAASDPGTVYVANLTPVGDGGLYPGLLRSIDGGWEANVHPEYALNSLRIAQVDPADAATLYLRVQAPTGFDHLAISHDGAQTLDDALYLGEQMSAFALGADGTLYVGSRNAHLWVRAPGATSFTQFPAPHLRCLGERGGVLYACADDVADGFALAASTDHGQTFHPVLRLQDVQGPSACTAAACATAWGSFETTFGIQVSTSSSGSSAPGGKKGCGCGASDGAASTALMVVLLALRRRRSS